jgi:hypothetical protein
MAVADSWMQGMLRGDLEFDWADNGIVGRAETDGEEQNR